MTDSHSVVGRRVVKVDAVDKVTGAARYTADLKFPGMLHGKLLRSPYASARIARIDISAAAALPGVHAILTYENTTKRKFSFATGDVLYDPPPRRDQVMFDARVRYAGEPVAAVAAESAAIALEALELIDVEYEALPAVLNIDAALREGAFPVHEDVPDNVVARWQLGKGDAAAALKTADVVVEGTFNTSRQKQAQMEPTVAVAQVDPSGKITCWTPSQAPFLVREQLAALFDVPMSKLRLITPHIGGAFGKGDSMVAEHYAIALALATRRPVRVEYSREEDLQATEARHPFRISVRCGFNKDGTLMALSARSIANSGAYQTHAPDVTIAHGKGMTRLYRCDNIAWEGLAVSTNTPPCGAYRGFGGPQAAWALEQIMDMAAERLGLDAIDIRRKCGVQTGDTDWVLGIRLENVGLQQCLDEVSRSLDWPNRKGTLRHEQGSPWRRGLGIACATWVSGTGCSPMLDSSAAILKVNPDGSAELVVGATDLGTGSKTTLLQIASEVVGIPFEQMSLTTGDTDACPFDVGSHGSRTLYVCGQAVVNAAQDAREQILRQAADLLEAGLDDIFIQAGEVRVKGAPDRAVSLGRVAMYSHHRQHEIIGKGLSKPLNAPPFAVQGAEVAVNVETGEVRIVNMVAAQDVGKAINPTIVEGQIEGALHHGIGYGILENLQVDEETGTVTTGTFMDYKLLTAADMPPVQTVLVEAADPTGPFGAKGVGEAGLIPTAPAIANAVYDAVGVRITDLPITAERVLSALQCKAERS